MDRSPSSDRAAVAAMAAGAASGLESVYRRYADRLYAYAMSLLGDGETAADVVQETFVKAMERVRQLRDPDRLSSWLYAIARNECLDRIRASRRTVALAESVEPVLDIDPGQELHAEHVRELVFAAAAGMSDRDREVLELTVRHGLSAAEVAGVLRISEDHAHARISRARHQFEGALGALMLVRDGRGRCRELDDILRDWDGKLTVLLRKRIDRHARGCDVCSARRRERMDPAALLAGYGALPFLAVGERLWQGLRLRPGSRSVLRRGRLAWLVAGLLAVLLTGGVLTTLARSRSLDTASAPATTRPATPPAVSATGSPTAAAARAQEPMVSGGATLTVATPPPAPASPPAFVASASALPACEAGVFRLPVTVTASGGALATARLYWRRVNADDTLGPVSLVFMTVSGSTAKRTLSPSARTVRWWVVARATDGREFTTATFTAKNPCPP